MPLYKGNEFIERIYKGYEPLRRVYKGNELVYGLYDINYYSLDGDYEPGNDEITKYAWGKKRSLAPEPGNTDFDDYFNEYRTHWSGWYKDTGFETEKEKEDTQYIVISDDKEDLNLYAKWKQKKFSYSGNIVKRTTTTEIEWNDDEGTPITPPSGSGQRIDFVNEIMSHIGEMWGAEGKVSFDWCAYYVSTCLKAVGYNLPQTYTFARDFYMAISQGKLRGTRFISGAVNNASGGSYSSMVIREADLIPGDIVCSWKQWNSSYTPPNVPVATHVVTVVSNTNGIVKVVGGNESARSGAGEWWSRSKVDGPHNLNFNTGDRWVVARLVFNEESVIVPSTSSSTTTTSTEVSYTPIEANCEDQDNPYIPSYYTEYTETITNFSSEGTYVNRTMPDLPANGTLWSALPSSWYTINGGWYLKSATYPGQCVWGANGRSGQISELVFGRRTAAPNGVVGGRFPNAIDWGTNGQYGGGWYPTNDWTRVKQGDIIVYGGTSSNPYGHVVTVEWVNGDGSFKASTWNSGGDQRFHGTITETSTPGNNSSYFRGYKVLRYVVYMGDDISIDITETDISTTENLEDLQYITSERTYNYDNNSWNDWIEVDRSSNNWKFDWEEE